MTFVKSKETVLAANKQNIPRPALTKNSEPGIFFPYKL